MSFQRPSLPRGMRDFLPAEMRRREHVFDIIKKNFERYGYDPLGTPTLEKRETLLGKYGEDAQPLIYHAKHESGKEALSLRYDLTVPLARVVAMHGNELPLPFKRYQLAPVWRAERPQRGRYREFYQCDADIVGSASISADAELIALLCDILNSLGFGHNGPNFQIRINNRKLLHGIGEFAGVNPSQLPDLYRSLDKYEKIGLEGVKKELIERGIANQVVDRLYQLLLQGGKNQEAFDLLQFELKSIPSAQEGINELKTLNALLEAYSIPPSNYRFDFTMVRGLGYYTGPIYEAVISRPNLGSISGGGRYDQLIGIFRRETIPTTGLSIGVERILDLMQELDLCPSDLATSPSDVFVSIMDNGAQTAAISLSQELRAKGLRVEIHLDGIGDIGKQLRIADRKKIPFVVILGPNEIAQNTVTSKRMVDGEQRVWPRENFAEEFARTFTI